MKAKGLIKVDVDFFGDEQQEASNDGMTSLISHSQKLRNAQQR